MPMMVDPFKSGGFGVVELSLAISEFPIQWGRLQQLNLFRVMGVASPRVALERYIGTTPLAPSKKRGSAGTPMLNDKRDLRDFVTYHIPLDAEILPDDIQDVRKLGSSSEVETATEVLARVLQRAARIHSQTLEWYLATTIRGSTLDPDLSVLNNWYTNFGVAEPTVFFDLSNASANIRGKCLEVHEKIEDGLAGGDMHTGVLGVAGKTWFRSFIDHAKVKEEFRYQLSERNREDVRMGFDFGGIRFMEYRANAKDAGGNVRAFIPDDECRFIPLGTTDTFHLWFAPADFMDTVNTIGIRSYARIETKRFNRGWDVHTQMNPLPVCARPLCLVKGSAAAA